MKFKPFFYLYFIGIFIYPNYIYSQSIYKNNQGKLYENNKELFRNDKFPFFVRGVYRLNSISIQPKLTPNDSIKIYQSIINRDINNCNVILDCLYRKIPDSLIVMDITEDSMKIINTCYSSMLSSIFGDKKIRSYSEYINPVKIGYVSVEFSLIDSSNFHSSATFDFPQLTVKIKGYIDELDNKYLLLGEFVMIKYRHYKDNSLRNIKKRIE